VNGRARGGWGSFARNVEFTLTYRGDLPSSQGKSQKRNKKKKAHDLRRTFHLQLANQWRVVPELRQLYVPYPRDQKSYWNIPEEDVSQIQFITRIGNYRFAPLVVNGKLLKLVCELNITLLSQANPGSIFEQGKDGGDLDNRLKVLLDALSIPQLSQLLDPRGHPATDEDPFFCLLQDDRLVTKVTVASERLLRPPQSGEVASYVELDIRVNVKASDASTFYFSA
jgi:hypothetical protein